MKNIFYSIIFFHTDIFSNCSDVSGSGCASSGVYHITVPGRTNPVQVYCDLNTDGGGWLVSS